MCSSDLGYGAQEAASRKQLTEQFAEPGANYEADIDAYSVAEQLANFSADKEPNTKPHSLA